MEYGRCCLLKTLSNIGAGDPQAEMPALLRKESNNKPATQRTAETLQNERHMLIYVLDIHGKPLMPTARAGKVRRMLADGRAVIAGHTPFTIRLAYETTSFVQPVSLGVDAGSVHVGLSATTDNKELYAAQIDLRTDIVGDLSTRREARRTRRSRLRHRAPRFDNRRRSEGRLAPSTNQKVESHIKTVNNILRFLPVTYVTVEVAQFDTQWIKTPGLTGTDYQHGEQFGFWNVREYVLYRDGHRCQCCHGKSKDSVLNVHHIESRQTGGDSPGNLVTLCETCHKAYHKGEIKLPVKRLRSLRDAAAMTVMRWKVYERLKAALDVPVRLTYGYVTKNVRIGHGLAKSHVVDARCISGHPDARTCDTVYVSKQLRRHNRKVMKSNLLKGGRWKRNQAPREIHGFRLFDNVRYNSVPAYIHGRRTTGYFVVKDAEGKVISNSVNYKQLELVRHNNARLCFAHAESRLIPPPAKAGGILKPLL